MFLPVYIAKEGIAHSPALKKTGLPLNRPITLIEHNKRKRFLGGKIDVK